MEVLLNFLMFVFIFLLKQKLWFRKIICNTCFSLEYTPLELPLVRSANRLMLTDKWILADKCWLFVWKYRTIDNVAEITLYQKLYQKFEIANGQSGRHSNKMNVTVVLTPIGWTKAVVKYTKTVFLCSRYSRVYWILVWKKWTHDIFSENHIKNVHRTPNNTSIGPS